MPVYQLGEELSFPPADHAVDGLIAVGGDLRPERLLRAYASGIFPWPHEGFPMLWFSPDPRTVLYPSTLRIGRTLSKVLRAGRFEVRLDTAFGDVIRNCARVTRAEGEGTWITPEMIHAYCRLHELGYAHSAEAWLEGELVGGLYGVSLGACFSGESMFALHDNASKVALVWLVRQLEVWGFSMVDCQTHTEHLARIGAVEVPRARFLEELDQAMREPTREGRWRFDAGFSGA